MLEWKIKITVWLKEMVFLFKPHVWLGWLGPWLLKLHNTLTLSKWMASVPAGLIHNDYYVSDRDYSRRYTLYEKISKHLGLDKEALIYLEFGVSTGNSFNWWLDHNDHPESQFYGFDTFEGLPEKWGVFQKGALSSAPPPLTDRRGQFYQGLFQDTLPNFIKNHSLTGRRKIIHLDADLFSATLFVLTSLGSLLQKGDVLIFDEFNVPNHEYYAFKIFCEAFYIQPRLIAAVNNYYEVAMIID